MSSSNLNCISIDLSQDGKKKQLIRSNAMCGEEDGNKNQTVVQNTSQSLIQHIPPPDATSAFSTPSSSVQQRQKHLSAASTISRESNATDYTDSTGIDLLQFVINTLHKNSKDREMLLSLETEMRKFVMDKSKIVYKFPKMSSYNRMLVHRVAAFFGLNHNIDQSGTLVVVNKTPNTRIPDIEFRKCIRNNVFTDRVLNRRSVQSFDEPTIQPMPTMFYDPSVVNSSTDGFNQTNNSTSPTATNFISSTASAQNPLDNMMRRARSFEVGEWHNEMATPNSPGYSLSNRSRTNQLSGSSWQANNSAFGVSTGKQVITPENPQKFLQRSESSYRPGVDPYFTNDSSSFPIRTHHISGSSIQGRNSSLLIHSATNSVDQSQDSGCFDNSALIKSATNEEIQDENNLENSNKSITSEKDPQITNNPQLTTSCPPPGTVVFTTPIQWSDGTGGAGEQIYDPYFMGYYPPQLYTPQQLYYTPGTGPPRYVQIPTADGQMQYFLTTNQFPAGPQTTQYFSPDA